MKRAFIYILLTIWIVNPALAMCALKDSEAEQKLKQYLSNIKTIAVDFTQRDTRGNVANGMLIIDKPHKFRCNYYAPFPILIVGNKSYVSLYDYEMEHFSRIKAEENIFHFLLVDEPTFANQFKVLSDKDTKNSYEVNIYNEDLGRTSRINFNKKSGQIEKIIIFEDDNEITITFGPTRELVNASNKLFIMQNPEIFGKPKRLNKKDLEKLIK